MTIEDQPPPIATTRRPAWDLVIDDAEKILTVNDDTPVIKSALKLAMVDMRERDRIGRERYKVPLTSGNGRNHLIDAYQEQLDTLVYLRAWLDEHSNIGHPDSERVRDRAITVAAMYTQTLSMVVHMRALIEDTIGREVS